MTTPKQAAEILAVVQKERQEDDATAATMKQRQKDDAGWREASLFQ